MAPPLTQEQEDLLNKTYYDDKNFFGRDRLWSLVKDKGISRRQVMDWLKKQAIHQKFAPTRRVRVIQPTILKKPLSQIGIDLLDMQNHAIRRAEYILTAIDLFSKEAWARPLPNKTARSVSTAMDSIIRAMPNPPRSIRSDRGSEFQSPEFQKVLDRHDVKQVFSLPGKPQSNGQIERFNGVLKRLIVMWKTSSGKTDWTRVLQELVDNYNETPSRVTGLAPDQIGDEDHDEIERRIREEVTSQRERDEPRFRVGDRVRLRLLKEKHQKSLQNWSNEIYEVTKVFKPRNRIASASYTVKNNKKQFSDRLRNNDMLLVTSVENPTQSPTKFEVSRIERAEIRNGVKGYIVRWVGYRTPTWEPRRVLLKDIPKMVKTFDRKHKV